MIYLKKEFNLKDIFYEMGIRCEPSWDEADVVKVGALGALSEVNEAPVLAFCKTVEAADRCFNGKALHPEAIILIPKESVLTNGSYVRQSLKIDNPKAVFFRLLDYLVKVDALCPFNIANRGAGDIQPSAIIGDQVTYGERVYVGHNSVIGSVGYGFVDLPDGGRLRIPHLSGVVIGSDVEIGDNTTVNSGVLEPTVIADGVKIDSNVLIGHGSRVGRNSLVVGGAIICGSVRLGEDCWVGPNSVIANGVTVGDRAHIGLGCVVSKSVPPDSRWIGNPPRRVA